METKKKRRGKENDYTKALVMTVVLIAVTIFMGIFVFRFYRDSLKEVEDERVYSQYYVMITEDQKSDFWRSVYQGAYERGLEEDVYVDLLGDQLPQSYTREDQMRIAIESDVDGIIVYADESEEMIRLINEAVAAGIPVVTLYGDSTHSQRCSFVGVGSYNLGREYGRLVLQIVNEREEEQGSAGARDKDEIIKVAVLVNGSAQDAGQNILCAGIQEIIDKEKGGDSQIEIAPVSVDDTNAFSIEESIRDIFMESDLPDIIVCLNELNTTCVYQAVVDYNKVGQVTILGYYDSDTIIRGIERNVIYATVAVDTEQMGQSSVEALKEYHELGYTSQYFTTDVTLISKENVSQYLGGGEDDEETP